MNTTMRSKLLLVRLAIGILVIAPCMLVPQAALPEEPGNPAVLVPHETIVDEKDKEKEIPMIPMLHCGKCPEGFVKTAVAAPRSGLSIGADFDMAEMCKGMYKTEETTVVECKPIGKQNQMPVCGTCPPGYREIGRSLLPALCGNEDGGLRTQCQLPEMQGGMPDPTMGGKKCPPDCVGNLPAPGQGNSPPHPPKYPSMEIIKEKPE